MPLKGTLRPRRKTWAGNLKNYQSNKEKNMSLTKEIIEQENNRSSANYMELHLHQEGSFLRAYDWSAWLACRYLHDFKVNKRIFKGIDEPVAYIGFPATSLEKWIPEGAEQRFEDEKELVVRLPELMLSDSLETMQANYVEWKDAVPVTDSSGGKKKASSRIDEGKSENGFHTVSLT